MKRKELEELLQLVRATGNSEAIAKLESAIRASNPTVVADWQDAQELATENKLTIKRGFYDDAANLLVEYGNKNPQAKDRILQILSRKLTANNNDAE